MTDLISILPGAAAASKSSLPRYLPVILVSCLGIAITVAGFILTERQERNARQSVFYRAANDRISAIESRIEITLGTLKSIRGLYDASTDVQRHEFRAFVDAIEAGAAVQAIEWIPLVTGSDRAAFESAARADGLADFQLSERDATGRLVRAGARAEYFPVFYVEPLVGNEAAVGFDLASNPARLAALNAARQSGEMTATERITLVQETGDQFGTLVFIPIYRDVVGSGTAAERRPNLSGFGLGVFRIGDLVEAAIGPARSSREDISIRILDTSAPVDRQLLYPKSAGTERESIEVPTWRISQSIAVAGRQWSVVATTRQPSLFDIWQPFAVLLTGLLFTGLLALHLRFSVDRTVEIEQIVHTRTADLKRVAAALTESNADLERFAYVSSHDLKAPLRAIDNLAGWIEEDLGDALAGEAGDNMRLLRQRVSRLESLLEDLLEYSRAGRIDAKATTLDILALVNDIVALFAPSDTHRIAVSQDLPTLVTAKAPLQLVFRNLIGNAIKHHGRATGLIEVSGAERGDMYEFIIADDGIGIPPELKERVFEMFQTLRPRDEVEGSGMGLAIVKRTVEQLGGTIEIDTGDNRPGTVVRFTWPIRWEKGDQA